MKRFNKTASATGMLIAFLLSPVVHAQETMIVTDQGNAIETFIYGQGSETLIIAAGNGRPASDLEMLAEGVAESGDLRVVTYNYRTIGESRSPLTEITLHDFADDVWRIADALGLRQVHLAGKTYGNRVMRTASADQPDRVSSLILIGAGGEILPSAEVQEKYLRYIDPNVSREEWLQLHAELNFAAGNRHLATAANEEYPALASAQVAASNATPSSEWVDGGTAPMMVITCLQDVVAVPQNGLNIAMSRPNTWLVGIAECGHNMVFEQPEALRLLLVQYVSRIAAGNR